MPPGLTLYTVMSPLLGNVKTRGLIALQLGYLTRHRNAGGGGAGAPAWGVSQSGRSSFTSARNYKLLRIT